MKIKEKLENELTDFSGLKNIVLFSSCRNALYTLLLSLKLKKNDEVIIQSFICWSIIGVIKESGVKPVLVDVDEETFNLKAGDVEKKITNNTKAIIFVHTYGNPSGIKEIKELCDKFNLILIEDIAHALGAKYDGKLAGTFGDYAISSFTKQMVNFGGGALITNKEVESIKILREKLNKKRCLTEYPKRFILSTYETMAFFPFKILINLVQRIKSLKLTNYLSPHFRCSSFEAYFALKQLAFINKNIEKRRRNYDYMKKYVRTQRVNNEAKSSYLYLSLVFLNKEIRKKFIKKYLLSSPPWQGSKISDNLVFIPNNPKYAIRRLDSFIKSYQNLNMVGNSFSENEPCHEETLGYEKQSTYLGEDIYVK